MQNFSPVWDRSKFFVCFFRLFWEKQYGIVIRTQVSESYRLVFPSAMGITDILSQHETSLGTMSIMPDCHGAICPHVKVPSMVTDMCSIKQASLNTHNNHFWTSQNISTSLYVFKIFIISKSENLFYKIIKRTMSSLSLKFDIDFK